MIRYHRLESAVFFMGKYVLIVDDDPDARELLEVIARSLGLEARSASDGLEALDHLRHARLDPPSLILLDLMMPSMDGFSVYSWLRGNPTTRRVPVIVVTAVERDQVDTLRLPGVSKVVQKGQFTIGAMSQLIEATLHVVS
jgi:CheY-like chemotaxis protein